MRMGVSKVYSFLLLCLSTQAQITVFEMGQRLIFQQDNDPKNTAKTMQEWLRDNYVKSPDLNPIEQLWKDLKMAVHCWSPPNLTDLEDLQRRMAENPQNPGVQSLSHICCMPERHGHAHAQKYTLFCCCVSAHKLKLQCLK